MGLSFVVQIQCKIGPILYYLTYYKYRPIQVCTSRIDSTHILRMQNSILKLMLFKKWQIHTVQTRLRKTIQIGHIINDCTYFEVTTWQAKFQTEMELRVKSPHGLDQPKKLFPQPHISEVSRDLMKHLWLLYILLLQYRWIAHWSIHPLTLMN